MKSHFYPSYLFVIGLVLTGIIGDTCFSQNLSQLTRGMFTCADEKAEGAPDVEVLFDGSLQSLLLNWHIWEHSGESPLNGPWYVEGQTLKLREGVKFNELVANKSYENFIMRFDWAISRGGNSGVKYNIDPFTRKPNGFEYQILDDDIHPDAQLGHNGNRKTGSLYDLVGEQAPRKIKPVGEFSSSCISFRGPVGEHWLNGTLVLTFDIESDDFAARVASSKFSKLPTFNLKHNGLVFLQDHGDEVSFRNIRIRSL